VLPILKYGLARLVVFVVSVTVLGLVGFHREVALLGGLLISALLSYVLLRRWRDPATAAVADRIERRQHHRATRAEEDALIEDQQVEESLAHQPADASETEQDGSAVAARQPGAES
jgi:hypothetical protein